MRYSILLAGLVAGALATPIPRTPSSHAEIRLRNAEAGEAKDLPFPNVPKIDPATQNLTPAQWKAHELTPEQQKRRQEKLDEVSADSVYQLRLDMLRSVQDFNQNIDKKLEDTRRMKGGLLPEVNPGSLGSDRLKQPVPIPDSVLRNLKVPGP